MNFSAQDYEPAVEVLTVTLNPAIDSTIEIENFVTGQVNRVTSCFQVAGGKGVNVAAVSADAGHQVAATGFLGQDNAEIFRALCLRKHIWQRFVLLPGATRTGIKVQDATQGTTTDINFPGLRPDEEQLEALTRLIVESPAKWVVLAGSLCPGVPADFYATLVGQLKAQGRKVALDTSGPALELALATGPHLIKPNVHELEAYLGYPLKGHQAVAQAARTLVDGGIETVVVSYGEAGALFVNTTEAVLATPPRMAVRSTVGAGDAMVAGTIAGLLRGQSLQQCARRATSFSLDALGRLEAGLTSEGTLSALGQAVTVTSVAAEPTRLTA